MAEEIKYYEAFVDVQAQTKIGVFAHDKNEAKELINDYLQNNTIDNTSYIFEVNDQSVHEDNIHEEDGCHVTEIINHKEDFEVKPDSIIDRISARVSKKKNEIDNWTDSWNEGFHNALIWIEAVIDQEIMRGETKENP